MLLIRIRLDNPLLHTQHIYRPFELLGFSEQCFLIKFL